MNMQKLAGDLELAFIEFQFRLDFPFPHPDETQDKKINMYLSNSIFHGKVDSMVAGVMHIVSENLE